ncbi:MAG: hypothetical protein U5L45_10885 [Saprospiraceae bacterium]|nr:hypothetical protein [Saprospiraceae bacterium]
MLRSQKGECGSFFGQSPKNELPLLPHASEASAWLSNYFETIHKYKIRIKSQFCASSKVFEI